ncbi:hypothetical protein ACP0SG_07615 [Campylobacter lari]|uniref:hypothetical protein n=2 Tax=Campylobacter lari TaxID=201 RepID=UPI003DA19B00
MLNFFLDLGGFSLFGLTLVFIIVCAMLMTLTSGFFLKINNIKDKEFAYTNEHFNVSSLLFCFYFTFSYFFLSPIFIVFWAYINYFALIGITAILSILSIFFKKIAKKIALETITYLLSIMFYISIFGTITTPILYLVYREAPNEFYLKTLKEKDTPDEKIHFLENEKTLGFGICEYNNYDGNVCKNYLSYVEGKEEINFDFIINLINAITNAIKDEIQEYNQEKLDKQKLIEENIKKLKE